MNFGKTVMGITAVALVAAFTSLQVNGKSQQAAPAPADSLLNGPVLDQTGLKGSYNFSLEFRDPRELRPNRENDSRPDLFAALKEQLGLQLQARKAPVDVVVIDHIERPSAN